MFFAYPLILWSDIITQRLFRGGPSRQNIVEFFSGSRTIDQRIMIIVFAVAIAPVIEEFLFRFFLYNVIKRYFGRLRWRDIKRLAVRRSARTFSFVCAAIRSGKLLRHRLRVERLHSYRDDNAFAFQFGHPDRPCISGDLFSMKLRDLGEDRLLNELLPRLSRGKAVVAGPGDDCAVVETQDRGKLLVLKTDCVVEGVHFLRGTNALDVGWKAMMRPLSDFAATSAVPQFALITLMLSEKTDVAWVKQLYQGLRRAADRFRVSIVGGETSNTPGAIAISASVIGFVERDRWVSRGGAKPGDDLFVTGRLGGASKRKHLRFIPRLMESRWLTKNFSIHAMMDLSDGLGTDLTAPGARQQSWIQNREPENLPLSRGAKINDAISKGEDYELLFAISPRESDRLEQAWRQEISETAANAHRSLTPKSANPTIRNCRVATFISNSPAETEAIGRQVAENIGVGSVLALKGDLGSGKTLFVKGVVAGLGSSADVTSPTFTILHEYRGGATACLSFRSFSC